MLLIQEKLRAGCSLEELSKTHGLNLCYHKSLPLVIINYDQIESKKTDKLACECRGLILELGSWDIVARSFNRFFNYGEMIEEQKDFDWSNFSTLEKVDGSLMLLWNYQGNWYVSTRGSFSDQNPNGAPNTWEEMFWSVFNKEHLRHLSQNNTYVFEFVSPFTKIVRDYRKIDLYLLTVIKYNGDEYNVNCLKSQAALINTNCPASYNFSSPQEILDWLDKNGNEDPTFEGFVTKDINGMRVKLKGKCYVSLHKLRGNNNIFSYKYLIPFMFDGELDELLVYFPECKDIAFELKSKVDNLINEAMVVWNSAKNEEYQKNFALAIKGRTPLGSVLFEARKSGVCPSLLFKNYQDLFLKILKE